MKDSPNLDLLRSVAVVLVVLSHLGLNLGWGRGWDIEAVGRVGVAVFFVHTSLVLMISLERSGETAMAFLVRRFFRIYPLAIAVVLLAAAGNLLNSVPVDGWRILSNLLLVQNLTGHDSVPAPLWSLPYEVQMYLFLPALFVLTRTASPVLLLALLWIACVVLTLLGVTLVSYVPCFLAGILAYILMRRSRAKWSPALLLLPVIVSCVAVPILGMAGVPEKPLLWSLCLTAGMLIPLCRQVESRPVVRLSKLIATYSYSIYLTHLFVIAAGFVIFPGLSVWAQWALFLAGLIAWPRVAYRWVEAPGIRLGVRVAQRFAKSMPNQQLTHTTGRAVAAGPVPHV